MSRNSWKKIFQNFLKKKKYDTTYKDLLLAAGHLNSKSGNFSVKKWIRECKKIEKKLNLENRSKTLEIGCGSGALLKYFKKKTIIYGVDYSSELLSLARKAIPDGNFICTEAKNINFEKNYFDNIILYSCIQYFNNINYFNSVLKKITKSLKKGGILFIGEIVDKDLLKEFKKYRIKKIGSIKYKKLYYGKNKNLTHFCLSKKQVEKIVTKNFKNIKISNSIKRGNEDNFYRFNLSCTKK